VPAPGDGRVPDRLDRCRRARRARDHAARRLAAHEPGRRDRGGAGAPAACYVDSPPPELARTAGLDELSERELEVLRLIGRGLSNAEIAAGLVISLATVKTHVRHVLQKLRLRDRVQAVVVAYESGLAPRTPARG